MRVINLKYAGNCRKCDSLLTEGAQAAYERRIGVFCPSCQPTDPEEIRQYRQEGADRKADRLEQWATKRRDSATTTLDHNRHYTDDLAFNTQPGYFPLRHRVIAQNDRANESLAVAQNMEDKADRLRHVRVAGDAARSDQKHREHLLTVLKPGMRVIGGVSGEGTILKVNRKTARIRFERSYGVFEHPVDLALVSLLSTPEVAP